MGGEFGHVTAVRDGLRCSCGRQGCLEMYVSDEAILRAYHEIERPGRGQASTIQEVAERAHAGEAAAREAFLVACRHLAREIVDLVQLLNPELIIIGGTLGEHADLCLPEIERFVREQAMPELSGFVHLVPSSLGADIGIKGAAAQALHQLIHSSEGMDRLLRPVPKPARRGSRAVAAP
jgi:glucokinase